MKTNDESNLEYNDANYDCSAFFHRYRSYNNIGEIYIEDYLYTHDNVSFEYFFNYGWKSDFPVIEESYTNNDIKEYLKL